MTTNDYRNTEYCPKLENVTSKKKTLEDKIKEKHPRQKIIYNKVHVKDTEFNEEFCRIYNRKCAYCGVSMNVIPNKLFEVDHFIAESSFSSEIEAGKLSNLVLACYQCNRNKGEFLIEGEYIEKLNTDDGKIATVFYRDENYYIRISKDYVGDKTINDFYNKLQLVHQTRRLDYLLDSMYGLYEKIKGTKQGAKLAEGILLVQRKRNGF